MAKKILKTKEYPFTVVYEPVKEGGYKVIVPLLQGLITYGRTFEEAKEMACDAIRCHVEAMRKDKEPIPHERSLLQERVLVKV